MSAPCDLSTIKGVLFDLDGTLLDTEQLLLTSFRHTMKQVLGTSFPDSVLMAKVGQPLDTQMWDFAENAEIHQELCQTYREYNALVHDDLIRIFPGTANVLQTLREQGYALGVVTSKRHKAAMHGLEVFGLEKALDFLIGSDDWETHKPDPGPVLHGCETMGLPAGECVYVGDSPFDMQAGNGAGCFTIAATWGMFPESTLRAQHPHFVCGQIGEVLTLLKMP